MERQGAAASGTRRAAEIYGARALADDIQDNPLNQTGQQITGRNFDTSRFGRSWQLGFKLAF